MSEQWEKMELGKVCEIILGQSPSSDTYNQDRIGLPFFQGKSEFGSKYAQAKIWCSDPVKIAKMNDILLSVRAPVGESNLAPNICCIGRGLAALRADQEKLLQEFLWHQIDFKKVYLQRISQGSTFDAISGKDLSELEIELPPLPEQKKIAEILSGIDRQISKSEKKIHKLQLSHASLSANAFQQKPDTEHVAVALGDVVELRHGYQFRTPDFAQHGAKVIKISQVIGDGIVFIDDCDRVPWELAADKQKFKLKPGDVLMSLTGNIGRVGIVPETDEVLLQNYRVGLFTPIDARISRKYMIHLLESRQVVSQLEDNANASAQANFGKGDLDKIMVYLPDLQMQQKCASLLSSSKDLMMAEKRKIAALRKIKHAVCADLLSGRKRVTV
jgi:type I restriction enzyme S subunit